MTEGGTGMTEGGTGMTEGGTGMTEGGTGMTEGGTGMTNREAGIIRGGAGMIKSRWLPVFALSLFLTANAFSQKIVCRIKITEEKLPLENQAKLSFLENELDNYINAYDWTEDEFGYEVNCEMEIAFEEATTTSFEDRYSASVIVSNGVDLQYADKRWIFPLAQNQRLDHSTSFNPFTSLLDFYFNLILAYEKDRYINLGGTPFLEAAKQINESAKFNSQYYKGWDRRTDLITDLMSQNHTIYRQLMYHYFTGIYFYQVEDWDNAKPHFTNAIRLISKIPRDRLERFFEVYRIPFTKALNDVKMTDEAKYIESFTIEK
jgi:hypothetical protein